MKTNNGIVKNANRFLVLNTIKNYGPLTVEDIVFRTRLSRPTVLNILKELTADKIIHKSGFAETTIGRQPALFSINPRSYYAIGIDFDFPPSRLAISDLNGNKVYSRSWKLNFDDDVSIIIQSLIDNIQISISESGLNKQSFIGLGIGFPAIIDINRNSVVKIDRIKGWSNIPVESEIAKATGLKVYVRNDAHLLGIVEKSFLNKDIKNLLYIVHRSGIGMAVFINNKLYEGNFGNSGYIGHTSINFNGEVCECGKTGCLELYSSKRAIVKNYQRKTKSNEKVDFYNIIERSRTGDKTACSILSDAGGILGMGISNAIKLFDVSHVVLGDSVFDEDNSFFTSFKESIDYNVSNYINQPINISLGKLEKDSYGLGGCYFVLNEFLKEPKLKLSV